MKLEELRVYQQSMELAEKIMEYGSRLGLFFKRYIGKTAC